MEQETIPQAINSTENNRHADLLLTNNEQIHKTYKQTKIHTN
ncbi:hypothetical protein [Serratia sp. 2723]